MEIRGDRSIFIAEFTSFDSYVQFSTENNNINK